MFFLLWWFIFVTGSFLTTNWWLINTSWVTLVKVYGAERPETPNELGESITEDVVRGTWGRIPWNMYIYHGLTSWDELQERAAQRRLPLNADTEQTGTVTLPATKGLISAWWHSVAVFLPVPFVFESSPACVFKGGDNMISGKTPGITVHSKSWWWSILQVAKDFFKQSLNRFYGASLSLWPMESLLHCIVQGRQWFSILGTCLTQHSWDFSNMVIFAFSRISILVTKSLQQM